MNIFEIEEIRRLVFEFLRKKAYCACDSCGKVCQWDQCGKMLCPTISYGGDQHVVECKHCFMEQELMRNMYATEFL
jgi:predicted amidophosphoribosyltransferase